MTPPKVSFGMIVFNVLSVLPPGMFELCVENIAEFAHEIIIVEGATKAVNHYFDGDATAFTDNGRSTDGTLDVLREMSGKYPHLKVISRDGFWDGKTQMCNVYSQLAGGDYIWHVDADEFYKKEDMRKIIRMLGALRPDAVFFFANHFFGGFNYHINEVSGRKWGNDNPWMRLFRHKQGSSFWLSHEPPLYVTEGALMNRGRIVSNSLTMEMGVKMFHYSYVTRRQTEFKSLFFRNEKYIQFWDDFAEDKSVRPFGAGVLEFKGEHPEIIKKYYNL